MSRQKRTQALLNGPEQGLAAVRQGRRPDWVALAGIAITIAVHLTLTATSEGPNLFFIGGASLFWVCFVAMRARQDRNSFHEWGFRIANLRASAAIAALLCIVAAAVLAIFAGLEGTLCFPLHMLLLMMLYPVWGIIQQFLALGIVVSNLERIYSLAQRKALLVLFGAALFGLVHAYDLLLAVGAFFLELATIPLFLRYRNLWPLGVLHGLLGGLFYLWVRNEDLWVETFR